MSKGLGVHNNVGFQGPQSDFHYCDGQSKRQIATSNAMPHICNELENISQTVMLTLYVVNNLEQQCCPRS